MKKKDELIRMGFVAHPHGLKGEAEIRLLNLNFDECVLEDGMEVTLFPTNEKSKLSTKGETWTLEKIRFGNKVLVVFKGMRDRTHLETLIPFEIYLDREQFPETDDDEVYLVDLVGMQVVSPEGEELGKLESFSDNGMQYLFEVRLLDGSSLSLPYVDAFFPEIDTENKKIVMIMPEYSE
ncbi:MAG TPA: ribosome maturation factor RimM [Bacteriovoracaceae bacterium]|nr:ribosome maturation factor RimM [Bacteriovoracaceae bacterium]